MKGFSFSMLCRNGKLYYKTVEVARLSGIHPRTLRRYLTDGKLAHFLFPFQAGVTGCRYWRLEPPEDTDVLLTTEPEPVWKLPEEGKVSCGK